MQPTTLSRDRRLLNGTQAPPKRAARAARGVPGWNDDDILQVAQRVAELRTANPVLTRLQAARQAQAEVLPLARQRVFRQERNLGSLMLSLLAPVVDAPVAPPPPTVEPEPIVEPVPVPVQSTRPRVTGRPKGYKPARTVRWSGAERLAVAKAFVQIREREPTLGPTAAMRDAMRASVPEPRWRDIVSYSSERPWLDACLPRARAELKLLQQAQQEADARAAEQQAEQQASEQAEQHAYHAAEHKRLAEQRAMQAEQQATQREHSHAEHLAEAIDAHLDALPFEDLLRLAGKRIAAVLLGQLVEVLGGSLLEKLSSVLPVARAPVAAFDTPVALEGIEKVQAAPRDHKPRVLVVGLFRQQETELKRTHGTLLDLSFIALHDQRAPGLEDKAKGVDLVICCTRILSHKAADKMKAANPNVHWEHGSLSSVRRFLTAWVNGEVALAA